MKVVILAGGLGTRLSEETKLKPKPMVEIGGMPILWHIMKIYSYHGFNDFIICLGYKGEFIKDWFSNYYLYKNDVTFNLKNNSIKYHKDKTENWKVTLINTGKNTMTGGRIKRLEKYIGSETFMATYGDGLSNVDIKKLLKFHKSQKKKTTLTAVQPEGRFGALNIDGKNSITFFGEKADNSSWVNAGFFVLEPEIFDYIKDDTTSFEKEPLENLSKDGELKAFHHKGFWKPMDKLSDKMELEDMWKEKKAKWKIWD